VFDAWFGDESTPHTIAKIIFGDRVGAAILFGAISFVCLYWNAEIFINDNATLVNALLNVSQGRLYFVSFYGGLEASFPGTTVIDGRMYGRNYGVIFAALPILWVVNLAQQIVGLQLVAVGFWVIALFGFSSQIGRLLSRYHEALLGWGIVSTAVLGANALFAPELDAMFRYVTALQILTIITTALVGLFTYRLISHVQSRLIGIWGGALVVLATGIGFWGWIPKRHVFSALLAVVAIFGFYLSRGTHPVRQRLIYRSLPYVSVGLLAWINAAEASILFTALLPVDLATAKSNKPSHLAVIATIFTVSLIPFFSTNFLITGDPLTPTRLARRGGSAPVSGGSSSNGISDGTPSLLTPFMPVFSRFSVLMSFYTDGLGVLLSDPFRIYEVFVARTQSTFTRSNVGGPHNLSILETTPVFGALIGGLSQVFWSYRNRQFRKWVSSPRGMTDVFVIFFTILFTIFYIPRLPLRVMFTVRYLVPIIPGLVYLLLRIRLIRQLSTDYQSTILWAYAFGVSILSMIFISVYTQGPRFAIRLSTKSLVSLHGDGAVVNALVLAMAILLVDQFGNRKIERIASALLGFAAAWGTVLILVSYGHYWASDLYLIP